jgi:hypothetical protein
MTVRLSALPPKKIPDTEFLLKACKPQGHISDIGIISIEKFNDLIWNVTRYFRLVA